MSERVRVDLDGYPFTVSLAEAGGEWTARVDELPGCQVIGADREAALAGVGPAILEHLATDALDP